MSENGHRPHKSKRHRGATKSPAYQWFPKDALTDQAMLRMSNEVEGLYRRLLDHAWLEDGLPSDAEQIFPLSKCGTRRKFDQLWMQIAPLLPTGSDGRRRSPRQEQERKKQRKNSRARKLAADASWVKRRERDAETAHANAHAIAVQVQCLPIALSVSLPRADLDQRQEGQRALSRASQGQVLEQEIPLDQIPRRMTRMRLSVWNVRTHLVAAIHKLIDSGAPYVDTYGEPVHSELMEELKTIASRNLNAEWEGRELQAILDGALGRRASMIEAEVARDSFRRREAKQLRALRRMR